MIHNAEAERSVVGALIIAPKRIADVRAELDESDFYIPAHRMIYNTIEALMDEGQGVDLVTMRDALTRVKVKNESALEWCGGLDYLVQCAESTPSGANAGYYAKIVREMSDCRKLIKRADEIKAFAVLGNQAEAAVRAYAMGEGLRTGVGQVSLTEAVRGAAQGLAQSVPCYLRGVNELMDAGGLVRGQTHGILATPGKGKTTAVCQQIATLCNAGASVALVTLEMSAREIMQKIIRQLTGYWNEDNAFREGGESGLEAYRQTLSQVEAWELQICDKSQDFRNGAKVSQILGWMTRTAETYGVDSTLIDYPQLITPDKHTANEWSHHEDVSKALREFAVKHNQAIIQILQITFGMGGKYTIDGSKQYGKDAATLMLKVREKGEGGFDNEFMVVDKNRFGRTGKVQTYYDARTGSVKEMGDK